MRENKLADLSMNFAMDGHCSLKNQFERSATSIGANMREANYAQSKADFLSKLQIALKECNESEYWLELLYETNSFSEADFKTFQVKCIEIRRRLVSSVSTLKNRA